jgi:hypothetical protein
MEEQRKSEKIDERQCLVPFKSLIGLRSSVHDEHDVSKESSYSLHLSIYPETQDNLSREGR